MVTCFLFILCVAANRKRRTNYRFTEIATCEIIAAVQLHCYTFNTPIRSTGIKQKRNGTFQIGFINKHVLIGRKGKLNKCIKFVTKILATLTSVLRSEYRVSFFDICFTVIQTMNSIFVELNKFRISGDKKLSRKTISRRKNNSQVFSSERISLVPSFAL